MASYNRVILMGNLTRDPEYRQLSSGQAVCRLGLASNRQFKNKQTGQMTQEVCFIDVDVWGAQAESCNQYLQKGRPVLIEGRLKFDSWQESDGAKRSKHSIVADRVTFLSGAAQEDGIDAGDEAVVSAQATGTSEPLKTVSKPRAVAAERGAVKSVISTGSVVVEKDNFGEIELKDSEPFEDDLPF